jgi:hypothetical protein
MKKFKNRDIREIIDILDNQLNEIDSSKIKYSPDSPSKSQKDYAASIGDADELISITQNKLKSSNTKAKSQLSQYKRQKGQDTTSGSDGKTSSQKFRDKQGTNEFSIDFSNIAGGTGSYTFNADGTTKIVTGNGDGKFKILTLSEGAVRCEGTGGMTDDEYWLISFKKPVKENQGNEGIISMYKDSTFKKKSSSVAWVGKMQGIK